ncbi:MAG: endonuclease [Bacteroidales bacterium]|nr:endonuclease [Bacteroidales bacterium]
MKAILLILTVNIYSLTMFSQIPGDYYDSAIGLSGSALKQELHDIITAGHNPVSYSGVWSAFYTTDVRPAPDNTEIWDMYSDQPGGTPAYTYTVGSDQCGDYSGEGSCYNREHSFPKSWFGGSTSAGPGTDIHHIVATDGWVNNKRNNFAFGEVSSPTWTSTNGSKVGNNSYPGGFTGTAFEPIDEYKGDFARIYFYMATRYKDEIPGWVSSYSEFDITKVFQSNGEFQLSYYSMLYEWHINDPVSEKELNRDTAIYDNQGNANPYISHSEWVCLVFGSDCPDNPTGFTATAVSETQIDLSWTLNDDSDDVLLAYNAENTFGIPTGTYNPGDPISGGGEVLYVGSLTSFSHESLTTQTYYYKLWSVNGAEEYSSGVETNAMPLLPEPSYNVTDFLVSNATSNSISLTWTDATGGQLPAAYLIKASTGGITPPVDGVPETDGQFVKNINYSVETVTFSGLTPSTTYFFEIYPYTNSGSSINYKTDSPESAIGNTSAGSSVIYSGSFETGNEGWTFYNTGGTPDWERTTDGGTYSPGDLGHDGTYYMWYYGWNGNANDWLISPELNFNGYTDSKFEFWSWMRNSGSNIVMKISTDYPGTGDPLLSAWTDLSPNLPSSTEVWTNSGEVDLSAYDDQICYVAFYYSGTDVDRNWAIDEVTVTGTLTSTNDTDSEALPPASQIPAGTISSLADTEPEAVDVFSFIIEDKGTSDGLITQVYNIRIYPGTSNTADWTDHIQAVKLNDGSDINISTLSITDAYINMLTSPVIIDDGEFKTFTLSVWLNSDNIIDNSVLSFLIDADNHGFVADNQFSEFATVFNSGTDIISNDFIIDVSGTELLFTQQASDTEVDQIMNPNPVLQMQDENGNADLDYEVSSVLYSEGVMSGEPLDGIWESGSLTFGDIIHTEDAPDIVFTVLSGTYEITGNTFTIYCNPLDVSNLNATCGNESSEISWTNPDCFDEVIIVVNDAPITGTPAGTYVANSLDYEDELNPDFPDGGKVVYNGTNSPQTVTGLTNGTAYYFKIFTDAYNMWSSGVSIYCTPVIIEEIENDFDIYPNPVEDILIIDYKGIEENYSVELISLSGISLLKANFGKTRNQINISNHPKGMYILKIKTDKNILIKRIILQ